MVTFQNFSRFFSRSSAGKFQLDVTEIRGNILASHAHQNRLKSFLLERFATISSKETPVRVEDGIVVALHVMPISSIATDDAIELSSLKNDQRLQPMYTDSWGYRFNFDGWLVHSSYSDSKPATSYIQVFRNGAIESVMSYGEDEERNIPSLHLEEMILGAARRYINLLDDLGKPPPLIVRVSLFQVKGARLAVKSGRFFPDREYKIESNELLLPEILLDSSEMLEKSMKPIFDVLWQTAGHAGSINFEPDGTWKPKR